MPRAPLLAPLLVLLPVLVPRYARALTYDGPARAEAFDVTRFGATGDGRTDDTKAIQDAADAAANARGGGLVVLPGGGRRFRVAPITLRSHVTLYVADGAALLATPDMKRYDLVAPLPSYGTGRDHPGPRHASLLSASDASDVVVTGGGTGATIDGAGQVWWDAHRRKQERYTRGHLLEFLNVTDVVVSFLTLQNSPFWTVHPFNCTNVVTRQLRIRNPLDSPNTDGVDPDSSQNVLIEDVDIRTGDDGVAIKSGWDCFGVLFGVPSRNITVRNMTVESPTSAGVCIGSEMSGGVSDVVVENVTATNVGSALRIKAAAPRGAYVTRVSYRGVTVRDAAVAVLIDDFYGSTNPACPPDYRPPHPPEVSDVSIRDVSGTYTIRAGQLNGLPGAGALRSLSLSDVHLRGLLPNASGWVCNDYVSGAAIDVEPLACASLRPPRWALV